MLSETAKKVLEAYGGEKLWKDHKYIEAEVSVKGLAFTLKQRPFFEKAFLRMEISKPISKITPIGKDKSISGILDGSNVRLENLNGNTIAERKNARNFFPYGRRLFYWDDLDMAYFANYAFWNYFTLPNLLMNADIEWTEKAYGFLEAKFPDEFPTHCKIQEFLFDSETGLLIQHNYTADIISKLAKAANLVKEHQKSDQCIYPYARQVTPRTWNGKALQSPILIDILVHSFRLTNDE